MLITMSSMGIYMESQSLCDLPHPLANSRSHTHGPYLGMNTLLCIKNIEEKPQKIPMEIQVKLGNWTI